MKMKIVFFTDTTKTVMQLVSDNYSFWASMDHETWEDSVDVMVGNPRGRPKPCIVMSVYDHEIVLQELCESTVPASGARFS